MSAPVSPCRLYVYLAREAPLAVVLRRGPSAWCRLSVWHTGDDTFEHGQWLSGRVFERRSDVSSDGTLFGYFVRKDTARSMREIGADSWIAVSRPPWFTALALWAIGGTYCTGACFPEPGSLFLGGTISPPDQGTLPPWLALTNTPQVIDRTNDWTDRTVYFSRLLRDGWKAIPDEKARLPWWERASPTGAQTLIMMPRSDSDFTTYGGRHATEYGLRDEATGDVTDLGRATWADWDQQGRLALARDGKLLRWRSGNEFDEIADFNAQVPEAIISPNAARVWPQRRKP